MTAFGIQAVKINNAFYAGVRGTALQRGRSFFSDGSDGAVHETMHSIVQSKPVIEFQTVAMKTMLAALGTSGTSDFPFVALDDSNGIIMYGAKGAALAPGYDATSVHVSRTALHGVLVMESVKWSPGNPAEMALRALAISSDGITDPITTSAAAALPTQQYNAEAYVPTALTLNGAAVDTIESLDLSVDHRFEQDHSTGQPYPKFLKGAGSNGRAAVRLSAEVRDLAATEGTGVCSVVFTALAQGGTLGSSTITFTLTSDWTLEESLSGGNASPFTRRLVVRPRHNGTTKPLTWAST